MFSDPCRRGVCLLGGDRIFGLRRARILNEHDACLRAKSDLSHETIMRLDITEHPPTSVEVHDSWEGTTGSVWPDDPQPHLTGRTATNGAVLTVGWQRWNGDRP